MLHSRCSHIVLFAVLCLIAATHFDPVLARSVALSKVLISRAVVYVITADLNDPSIKVAIGLPARGISHSEPFHQMVRRSKPVAAVTGTYFDTRSLLPVGTIVIDGKPVFVNSIGTTVCFTRSGVEFVGTAKGEKCDMSAAICGLRTGPRLLEAGAFALNPSREGFRHPGLFGSRTRIALGVTRHNKLLLVAVRTPVTFGRLAGIMKTLGSADAVCLDGGTSSAMSYRGRIICSPGRTLTNLVEIRNVSSPSAKAQSVAGPAAGATRNSLTRLHPDTRRTAPSACYSLSAQDMASPLPLPSDDVRDTAALPGTLRLAESFHAFFPVHRTKLAGLKRA